jgi:hypothetical protein
MREVVCVYCGAYHPAIQPSNQSVVLLFHTHPLLQLWVIFPFSHAFSVLPVLSPDLTGPNSKTSYG